MWPSSPAPSSPHGPKFAPGEGWSWGRPWVSPPSPCGGVDKCPSILHTGKAGTQQPRRGLAGCATKDAHSPCGSTAPHGNSTLTKY